MKKDIVSFVESVRSNDKISSFDEASIKQAVVMRLLSLLGWDIFDVEEVVPDYADGSDEVDYALRLDGKNKVFISVEKAGAELSECQNGLLDFAFQEGVPLSFLTNGLAWWVFLSSLEDAEDQKKVFSMDLSEQDPEDAGFKLEEFLDRENVVSGVALKSAKSYYALQKKKLAGEMIPKAWLEILSDPDEALVALIEERTESLCDFPPDKKMISKFLSEQKALFTAQEAPEEQKAPSKKKETKSAAKAEPPPEKKSESTKSSQQAKSAAPKKAAKKAISNYNGTSISSFGFKGKTHDVASWDEMTTALCNLLVGIHKEDFDKVLWSSNSNRPYFSNNSSDLRNPAKVQHTGIYVEVNLSPNDTVKLARNTLSIFGYSASDLTISLQED